MTNNLNQPLDDRMKTRRDNRPSREDHHRMLQILLSRVAESNVIKRMHQNYGSQCYYTCLLSDIRAVNLLLDAGADVTRL
ncbi:uncharacterized protein BDZ99DRAFT_525806 [Mytilinidion resinicola]|uniref:Peptidase A2 domain-containing protein n=1 Tax=Mytilinidion resinicola TaxID=574789 RepID=A0A6A6Y8B7_9PEZI|nr:uncharacterized protein BDZ99DRAFT_525806 [Mytilinidion resinicola]KAF2804214.1 hypothetical protein BDZ99DRAFT_525806 [Mytilinidion resinicola]